MSNNFVIGYELAIEHYVRLQHKSSNGVLTEKEQAFVSYIDIHCYSGFNRAKRISHPSEYIQNKIVQMKRELFV